MARITYADETAEPAIAALASRIRAERDGRIPNIYRMLLNSYLVSRFLEALRIDHE